MEFLTLDLLAKVNAAIDKRRGPDACWEWLRARTSAGYGTVKVAPRRQVYVHRIIASVMVGRWLNSSEIVRHSCDNPPCCNPAHLMVGTQSENIKDCVERGRHFSPGRMKEECPRGHPYDDENTYLHQGRRHCRTCRRDRRKSSHERQQCGETLRASPYNRAGHDNRTDGSL